MDIPLSLSITFVVVLLILSAFFSGSETALTAASRPKLHNMAKKGNQRAKTVNKLRADSESLIGAILFGNNLVNIMASAFTTTVLLELFGDAAILYTTIGMTMLVLIFAEVLPKTIALNKSNNMALWVAPPIRLMVFIFKPITIFVQMVVRLVLRLFGMKLNTNIGVSMADDELRGAIDMHAKNEATLREESVMLHSILDLDNVSIEEVMTHRRNLVMLDINSSKESLLEQVVEANYTRFPIFRDDPDNIIGVLHTKDLFRKLKDPTVGIDELHFEDLATDPWFVHESTNLLDQLQAFKARKEHIAHIIDEYGSLMGIVTLEDILEEIVGEIDDEHDEEVAGIRRQPDTSYLVNGDVTLRDLNRALNWELPDDEASTIAGLVLYESKDIPTPGQIFEYHGVRFKIIRRQRNQIKLINIKKL